RPADQTHFKGTDVKVDIFTALFHSLLCSSLLFKTREKLSRHTNHEENRVLQGELARLEDLLAHSRADRDELAIKYGAISERVRTTD
ncbi:hypothetical protein XENOCAPTIV_027591, partial [Xenoophorus captivus]